MAKRDQFSADQSRDRRTIPTVKRLVKTLSDTLKPSEIAARLGITTQKWTAIKKQVKSGKLYNPELKKSLQREESKELKKIAHTEKQRQDKLKRELEREYKANKKAVEKERAAEKKRNKEIKRLKYLDKYSHVGDDGEFYFSKYEKLKKEFRQSVLVKTHRTYEGALNWWKGITGGSSYFAIAKKEDATKRGGKSKKSVKYVVVDIRTNKERSANFKGKLNGESYATKILNKVLPQRETEETDNDE